MRAENTVADIEKSLALLRQRMDWETAEHRLEEFNAIASRTRTSGTIPSARRS